MSDTHPLICIVGPTATGKSELAQRIAETINTSILSADSMQIYRGMDIGTAKVPAFERTVPYFGIDLIDPGEAFSAALYQDYARKTIEEELASGEAPILVGGTGFYVKATIDDMDFAEGEQTNNPIREKYHRIAEEVGAHELWKKLHAVDPKSANVIHENDVKRVIRAFELHESGECYASRLERLQSVPGWIDALQIGISVDPDLLKDRIDHRIDAMREEGLVEEVQDLLHKGFREGITAPQAIGYKEIVHALDTGSSLDKAFDEIKCATRRYAKRQRTWFRKDKRIQWLKYDLTDTDDLFERAMNMIDEARTRGHHGTR